MRLKIDPIAKAYLGMKPTARQEMRSRKQEKKNIPTFENVLEQQKIATDKFLDVLR